MPTWREKAEEARKSALALVEQVKAEGRDLNDDEMKKAEELHAQYTEAKAQAERSEKAASLVAGLAGAPTEAPEGVDVERGAGSSEGQKSALGWRIVQSDAFKSFRKAHPTGTDGGTPVRVEVKNVGDLSDIGMKATLDTTFGQARPTALPGYQNYLPAASNIAPTLLDLITVGQTDSATLEYRQVVAETNSAAIVAEGALKPLSDITTDAADAKVFTYADGFDATNQFLADEPALATFMDGAVRQHLRMLIEDRLLNGPGGASAPTGILATTGVQAQAFTTDVLTTLANALQKVDDVNGEAQAIVLHPSKAWALRLLKDADGRYLSGGPFSDSTFTSLWGVPVVMSRRVATNTALVGNFRTVNFLQREPLSVLAFNQHKDYAQRNMVYVRAELRAMQLIYSPREIVVATLA
ncbi:MAG: phage major capsid protein [Thermoleophilia bacterium]|nr:phage major capsid protein [Thermoleophilia bacterium]